MSETFTQKLIQQNCSFTQLEKNVNTLQKDTQKLKSFIIVLAIVFFIMDHNSFNRLFPAKKNYLFGKKKLKIIFKKLKRNSQR